MKRLKWATLSVFLGILSFGFSQETDDNTLVFYFARHGKTILNTMHRAQGWSDATFTPEGQEVVELLGQGVKAERILFKSVYSSDLGRARATARIVLEESGQTQLPIQETTALRETSFGSYEGAEDTEMWRDAALYLGYRSQEELWAALREDRSVIVKALAAIKELETLGIGEDYDDVKIRSQAFIREIAKKEAETGGGNILVTAHGMLISILLSDLDDFGNTPPSGPLQNASVSKFIYKDDKFKMESFGDMSYVEKGRAVRAQE